ncbi:hypothetical protein BH23BAC4_BH23BAC4_06080 [soil metagenome]
MTTSDYRLLATILVFTMVLAGCRPERVDEPETAMVEHPDTTDAYHEQPPVAELQEAPAGSPEAAQATPAPSRPATATSDRAPAELLTSYFAIGDLLAEDRATGTAPRARELSRAAARLPSAVDQRDAGIIQNRADRIAASTDLGAIRLHYSHLSDALDRVLRAADISGDMPVHFFHCGMYTDGPRSGVWLQRTVTPRNPYFGSTMLTCVSHQEPL